MTVTKRVTVTKTPHREIRPLQTHAHTHTLFYDVS